jgi:hypothetical protein
MTNYNIKRILQMASLFAFFLIIIVYAFFSSRDLIFGVKVKDVNIADGTKTRENILQITGNAKNAVNLTLNGRDISIDEEGNFGETIALLLGYNKISIRATDKFEYVDAKNYQLIYQP